MSKGGKKGEDHDRRPEPEDGHGTLPIPRSESDGSNPRLTDTDKVLQTSTEGSGPLMIGTHFRVVRKIGEGGMGSVYEVEHVRMHKRFAAKVIRKRYSGDEEALQRFELEAIAAGKIESGHIVQVVDLNTVDEYTYIIMELLRGQSLAAYLKKKVAEVPLAIEIARQITKGLIAAHQVDIVHRDLKPENIFLSEQDGKLVVKILDFGISKMMQGTLEDVSITKTGQIMGTPLYFSPEQARNSRGIDNRTDIYSLGIIMFEMLTGEPTFMSTSPAELIFMHISEPPPRPSKLNPDVTPKFEDVILRCLEKDPADRYQSAEELLEALDKLALGQFDHSTLSLSAPDQPPPKVDTTKMGLSYTNAGKRGRSRILIIAGGVGVLAVLVVAVLAFTTDFWKRPSSGVQVGTEVTPSPGGAETGGPPAKEPSTPAGGTAAPSAAAAKAPAPPPTDAGTDPEARSDVKEPAGTLASAEPKKPQKKPVKVKPPTKTKPPVEKKPPATEEPAVEPTKKVKPPEHDWTYP